MREQNLKKVLQVAVCVAAMFTAQCRSLGSTPSLFENYSESSRSNLPDVGKAGISEIESWSRERIKEGEVQFASSGAKRYPSPDFWGAQTIYQIMVDRFNDGDPGNNFILVGSDQRDAEASRYANLPFYHHGGDIKGITQRLDYIADLGMSAIWLTPVLLNSAGDYHGYCTTDFTQVDPNYGTKEDLRELVSEAHKRGIRVILDVVVNHMCDAQTRYAQVHTSKEHHECAGDLSRESEQSFPTYSPFQKELQFSQEFFPPLRYSAFFNRCGGNTQAEMEGSDAASVFGDFTLEMLDFETRNYDFQEIFANLLKYWVAYADVDGFRLDAVKHVTPDFTAYLATTMRDYGQQIGKNHIYVVSEIAGDSKTIARHLGKMDLEHNSKSARDRLKSPVSSVDSRTLGEVAAKVVSFPYPGSTAVYDFAHSGISRDVFQLKRPSSVLHNYFTTDSYYKDITAQGDPRLNFTLLEIHDWNRFNFPFPNDMARSKMGLSYLALAPGIPIIYYGMEQGFNGHCRLNTISGDVDHEALVKHCNAEDGPARHPLYRQDMFQNGMLRLGSSVPSIDGLAYIGRPTNKFEKSWEKDPYLDRSHDLYKTTRKMLRLRSSCNPLKYGSMAWRLSSEKNGEMFAFSRLDYGQEALVVVNPGKDTARVPMLEVATPWVEFVNVENPHIVGRPTSGGKVNFGNWLIQPSSVAVFVPRPMLGNWSEEHGIHLCASTARVSPLRAN